MIGVVKEMKAKVCNAGREMSRDNMEWMLNTNLFANDTGRE